MICFDTSSRNLYCTSIVEVGFGDLKFLRRTRTGDLRDPIPMAFACRAVEHHCGPAMAPLDYVPLYFPIWVKCIDWHPVD
jgi:hypothetical protein